jgi:serine/threonine-protein kinase
MRSVREIDARADIWALGVILYELVTGVAPFDGETMPALLAAILQDPTPPLRKHLARAPQGLEAIVARCLEKDPAARYADVAELTEALAPFGSAMARVSADRVSRVIRPRPVSDRNTSVPIVRATIPSVSELRRGAPTNGVVTVSATADAWGATSAPNRSKVRRLGLAAGALFFATTMILAIFGAPGQRAGARTRASAEESVVVAPPPAAREPEPAAEHVDLAPIAVPEPVAPPRTSSSPSPKPPPALPAKRRAASTVSTPAASTPAEADLFDGRK